MSRPKRTSQRRAQSELTVIDSERISLTGEKARVISKRKANKLSVQDVRDMTMTQVLQYAPLVAQELCELAAGNKRAVPGQIQAINSFMDRLLPRLQGIAIQNQIEGKVEWTWKNPVD